LKTLVVKRTSFDAAHFLPNYEGKCHEMHGHHWLVDLGVIGDPDPISGMVIDFSFLNKFLKDVVVETLDHHTVNDTVSNPTAENIAHWILKKFRIHLGPKLPFCSLSLIRVWETENSYAELAGDNLLDIAERVL
jgi:6-pyruvoyltetrahydropterin/6-carboxytetrahydropterin synthase